MECLVGPLRAGQRALVDAYERVVASVHTIALTTEVFRQAAEFRARMALRTPDAIHLAAASVGECSALWANDRSHMAAAGDFVVAVVDG